MLNPKIHSDSLSKKSKDNRIILITILIDQENLINKLINTKFTLTYKITSKLIDLTKYIKNTKTKITIIS